MLLSLNKLKHSNDGMQMVFYCLPGVSEDSEEFRRALQQRKAKERMILVSYSSFLNDFSNVSYEVLMMTRLQR